MIYILKIVHKVLWIRLFKLSTDWQTRSKLVESDFQRCLDDLAVKDKEWIVRQTLASQRISQKTQNILAKDTSSDVLHTLAVNPVVSEKTWKNIREYLDFEKELYGRFYNKWKI